MIENKNEKIKKAKKGKMQDHLRRAIYLLILGIIMFSVVRTLIVPKSFNEYGWYRADAVNDLKNFKVQHADSFECLDCHESVYTVWSNGSHKTVNCDDCHGPTKDHVNNNRIIPQPANDSREFCGFCHFKNVARPKNFPQIDPSTGHGENLKCTYCHNPHKPWFV